MSLPLFLLPLLPLMGAVLILLTSVTLTEDSSKKISPIIACVAALAACLVNLSYWQNLSPQTVLQETAFTWIAAGTWQATVGFYLDNIALVMTTVVTVAALLIHLYAASLMQTDPGIRRFFFYLNLFLFSMLILVMADNLLLLYLGWEGVGLCSFALIGFWYEKSENAAAGRKAFTVTRVGDTALALGIFLLFSQLQSLDFQEIFAQANTLQSDVITLASLLILIGALGKSAQLPLHVWLPDAMAGPAPVSALIHAATMVTAGVYLLIRCLPLISLSPQIMLLTASIGACGAFYGASCALGQTDLKRMLAYSTMSQVGYMFLAVGSGAYAFALFHLTTHAAFKALLFLSAGAIMHATKGHHKMKDMGGFMHTLPQIHVFYLIGIFGLAAIPWIGAGFFSKEPILNAIWYHPEGFGLWILASLAALLTVIYSLRSYLMIFHGPRKILQQRFCFSTLLLMPMFIFALLSLTLGWLQSPLGTHIWLDWLAGAKEPSHPWFSTLLAWFIPILGGLVAFYWVRMERLGWRLPGLDFLHRGWDIDGLYAILFVKPYKKFAQWGQTWIESGGIENINKALCQGFFALAFGLKAQIESMVIGGFERLLGFILRLGHAQLSQSQQGDVAVYLILFITGAVFMLAFWLFGL